MNQQSNTFTLFQRVIILLPKKMLFIKRIVKFFFLIINNLTYYSFPNISHFLQSFKKIHIFNNVRFCARFMCFILINDHNFKSCQNMLTTLRFILL